MSDAPYTRAVAEHIAKSRFEDLPPQELAWRTGLAGIDEAAHEIYGHGFTELNEVLRFQLATFEERLNVVGAKMRLLQSKLRCPRQCRLNVLIEGDVT